MISNFTEMGYKPVDGVKNDEKYFAVTNGTFTVVFDWVNMCESKRGFTVLSKFEGQTVSVHFVDLQTTLRYCDKTKEVFKDD